MGFKKTAGGKDAANWLVKQLDFIVKVRANRGKPASMHEIINPNAPEQVYRSERGRVTTARITQQWLTEIAMHTTAHNA